jgi:hypothetical protein
MAIKGIDKLPVPCPILHLEKSPIILVIDGINPTDAMGHSWLRPIEQIPITVQIIGGLAQ